jgi:hypothetical protein
MLLEELLPSSYSGVGGGLVPRIGDNGLGHEVISFVVRASGCVRTAGAALISAAHYTIFMLLYVYY